MAQNEQLQPPQRPLTPLEVVQAKKQRSDQLFPEVQHWQNLQGFLKTVTVIPTLAPKSLADAVIIYIDDLATPTDKRLYLYSREAAIWSYITLT